MSNTVAASTSGFSAGLYRCNQRLKCGRSSHDISWRPMIELPMVIYENNHNFGYMSPF
ncbi:hypothetical protein Hdeb2414_s1063g00977291 [Helianthus debilis subsp. tardiflorus]